MVARVKKTFSVYPWEKLDNCWGVLHEHYRLIRMFEVEINISTPIVEFVAGSPLGWTL